MFVKKNKVFYCNLLKIITFVNTLITHFQHLRLLIAMTTGNKIKHFRLLKGFSQEKMAELLDITPKSYGNIERDITDANISRLLQIAEVLEVSLPKLLDFDVSKITQVNGDVSGDNSSHNYQPTIYNSDKDLAHALEKSQQEVSFLKEKNTFLEKEIENLKEINGFLREKTK